MDKPQQNQAIKNLIVDRVITKNQDMHGRRVINAGFSVDPSDYVTRAEFDKLQAQINLIKQKVGI